MPAPECLGSLRAWAPCVAGRAETGRGDRLPGAPVLALLRIICFDFSSTSFFMLSLSCPSFFLISAYLIESISHARMHAFREEFTPTVATGTPLGIWTIERSESRPFKASPLRGMPITGSVVWDATTPGR